MSASPKIRRFRCPDALWDAYERIAAEQQISLDELITTALADHAQRVGIEVPQGTEGSPRAASPGRGARGSVRPPAEVDLEIEIDDDDVPPARTAAPPAVGRSRAPTPVQPPGRLVAPQRSAAPPAAIAPHTSGLPPPVPHRGGPTARPPLAAPAPPPPLPPAGPSRAPLPPVGPSRGPAAALPPPPLVAPPMPSRLPAPPPGVVSGSPSGRSEPARRRPATLWLTYGGARFPVDKDRFVIGRVKNSCDLVIKDPNVSRSHAVIERQGSAFVIQDMGSTNGIVHQGQRVARRTIEHGDAVYVCEHELRFTFE